MPARDLAPVEDEHVVGVLGGAQPVRDRHGGATGRQSPERLGDARLGGGVDRARGLVEDQQAWVGDLGAHESDQLPLADRELFASLTGARVEPVLQREHPVTEAELLEGGVDLAVGGPFAPDLDVLPHRPVEEEAVLGHHADRDPA